MKKVLSFVLAVVLLCTMIPKVALTTQATTTVAYTEMLERAEAIINYKWIPNPTAVTSCGDSLYLLFDESLPWTIAQTYCESIGGHLVSIASEEEDDVIFALIEQGQKAWYYIGASKLSGEWKWIDDGANLSSGYSNWSSSSSWGNYLMKYKGSGDWIGIHNFYSPGGNMDRMGFVCEIDNAVFTVSYNANGGSGAPESQTKYYNAALTLSEQEPTRTGYTFLGWATSSSATNATYQPGGSFVDNANETLYAVWKQGCDNETHNFKDGVCDICGEADPDYVEPIVKFDFSGSTMTLGNELVLNFVYNKALLTGTDNYAKVTIAREDGDYTYEIPQSEWTAFNASLNQIPVKVFAKEMTDEVTVVICNAAGQEVSNPRTGSVVAYCNNLFEKSNVQEDKAMAVDMLNYGAAAQIQFNYREETLANAGLSDELKALATVVTDMQDSSSKGPGCAGNTLTLEDKILLNFVYQNATIDKAAYATVSYVDHYDQAVSYNIEAADFLTFNSSMKMVQINTLVVTDCRTMVSVELFDADGNSLGVSKTSVESYTARSGQELFKAILAFGDSAYAKFH